VNEVAAPLLEVTDLKVHFALPHGIVRAVDGITFSVAKGATLGLVGESGSGKSTVARTIVGLNPPTDGSIVFDGDEIGGLSIPRGEIDGRVCALLERVGLDPSMRRRYPHEFSGGQRQRVGVARALAVDPELLLLDEPVSALDVSVQAQILNLLESLKGELGLSYLFIAHNLAVVRHVSDRVAVMYLGRIVEVADRDDLYAAPIHPYTQALLSAVPVPDPVVEATRRRIPLEGEIPSPTVEHAGCPFRSRCAHAFERCAIEVPRLVERAPGHAAACHLPERT
jgi:oligopeptide transport system ATP-binding protein